MLRVVVGQDFDRFGPRPLVKLVLAIVVIVDQVADQSVELLVPRHFFRDLLAVTFHADHFDSGAVGPLSQRGNIMPGLGLRLMRH